MKQCKRCGSYAINHGHHGRDGSDRDLCDVCYWRKRAEKDPDLSSKKELVSAAINLVDVKGRYHTELAMHRLIQAVAEYRKSL